MAARKGSKKAPKGGKASKKKASKKKASKKKASKKKASKKKASKKKASKKKASKKKAPRGGSKPSKKVAKKNAAKTSNQETTSKKKATKKKATKKKATKKKATKTAKPTQAAASAPTKRKAKAPKTNPQQQSLFADSELAVQGSTAEAREIGPGDAAPTFSLRDQDGGEVSAADLEGAPYVLYFYPKDDTPGCTTEACSFRDALGEFTEAAVRVLGVSPDTESSHQRFSHKYGLNFTLLSDPAKSLANAYGTWKLKKNYGREYMGIERSTFLVGADGRIAKAWRKVRVAGHTQEVLAAAASL